MCQKHCIQINHTQIITYYVKHLKFILVAHSRAHKNGRYLIITKKKQLIQLPLEISLKFIQCDFATF